VIRFAIVGTGGIAEHALAPALGAAKGAQLWSVHSRDLERARAFASQFRAASPRPAYDRLDALLADPELDAVILATPDGLHAEQAIAAARAKKHVLCEKPMATTLDGGRAMVQACREAGVRLGVAYHLRWHAGHRALAKLVHGGALGELRHVRVQWTYRAQSASNWRAHDEVGRWWSLAGVGTHCLDLVRWMLLPLAGEVTGLRSLITRPVWRGPNDETALVALEFAGGATAELTTSVLFDSTTRVELYGTKSLAVCEGTLGPHGQGRITVGGQPLAFEPVNPYVGELIDFVRAIEQNRDPEVSGEEGLRNIELLLEAAPRAKS
jgi:1,5-anhydro-D-fructose reductase (1,5-anhydro-D-mannitol-forming)